MKKLSLIVFLAVLIKSLMATANVSLHNPQEDYPGSPEKPLTAFLIEELYKHNDESKVFEAWALLAQQRDGYAESAKNIFGSKITLHRCVVESNWKVVVGEDVRLQHFGKYAQTFQRHYIKYLDVNHRYPNTYDIEKMYQTTNSELGLPQKISVDLLLNSLGGWRRHELLDGLAKALGVGRQAEETRKWFHYVNISDARVSDQMVKIEDTDISELKSIYKSTTMANAKCMLKILKPTPVKEETHQAQK